MKKIFFLLIYAVFLIGTKASLHPLAEGEHLPLGNKNETAPKNVIFLIGDGLGVGQIEIARRLEYGREGKLYLESMPFISLVHTHSADSDVTDSAAGGTALAIGKKTNNGMIGVTPDGKDSDSILDIFKQHGKKTGIISTNTVTDATPAAFTASVQNRWSGQEEIARQQLKNNVDVLLGGGRNYFQTKAKNGRDLIDEAIRNGYTYVSNREELQKANGNKLLGLFHPSYMSFKIDRKLIHSKEPSLKEMTAKAIDTLSQGNEGFFLMAEGARIDHASHASDITGVWKEVIEFDEAVQYAVEWAMQNGNTLVIVAADHETMGISSTENMNMEDLKKVKASPEFMVNTLKKNHATQMYDPESIKDTFRKYANIQITDEEIEQFNWRIKNLKSMVYPQHFAAWEIGSMIASHYKVGINSPSIRTSSSTGGHTSNPILLFSYGTGAEQFHGVLDNTDVPRKIADLMGYIFK